MATMRLAFIAFLLFGCGNGTPKRELLWFTYYSDGEVVYELSVGHQLFDPKTLEAARAEGTSEAVLGKYPKDSAVVLSHSIMGKPELGILGIVDWEKYMHWVETAKMFPQSGAQLERMDSGEPMVEMSFTQDYSKKVLFLASAKNPRAEEFLTSLARELPKGMNFFISFHGPGIDETVDPRRIGRGSGPQANSD